MSRKKHVRKIAMSVLWRIKGRWPAYRLCAGAGRLPSTVVQLCFGGVCTIVRRQKGKGFEPRRGKGREMRYLAIAALVLLAACGGRSGWGGGSSGARVATASGPIATACLQAGRQGATSNKCGCVQAVANRTLSSSDQALGSSFFKDPHRAQEIRQSSSPRNEAFWAKWKAFGDEAEQVCKAA